MFRVKSRLEREFTTINAMIVIYCSDHHGGSAKALCSECAALLDYAGKRLDNCPFAQEKPACNHCTVHCYGRSPRERVRDVMRYAGPRMMYRHPVLAFRHLLDKRKPAPKLPIKMTAQNEPPTKMQVSEPNVT